MTTDLTGLEQTAARMGLDGLRARLVPADRRRGSWFRWGAGELLVSERVVERLLPAEGQALLIHAVIEQRQRRRATGRWLLIVALLTLAGVVTVVSLPGTLLPALVTGAVLALVSWATLSGQAGVAADDEAVRELGDPELLVRALNTIQKDELHIGRWKGNARPDLHRRAERLVALHQLRLPAELRSVEVIAADDTPEPSAPAND
jgi:hypothetical protein